LNLKSFEKLHDLLSLHSGCGLFRNIYGIFDLPHFPK